MIVSAEKKFIYIHIYKTGGSSLTDLLSSYVAQQYSAKSTKKEGYGWQPTWHLNGQQHNKFAEALPILDRLNIKPSEYFLFTFVRNPYSWILSVWNNFYRNSSANFPTNNIFQKFKKFYKTKIKKSSIAVDQFQKLYPDASFKSLLFFLDEINKSGTKAEKQYWGAYDQYSFIENDRNIQFDFIGKLENFNQDAQLVLKKLNIETPLEIPHRTSSNFQAQNPDYLSYYDQECLEIVNRLFQRDFAVFDYQKINSLVTK